MVRDLVEIAVDMVREERVAEVQHKAERAAEERLLDLLLPPPPAPPDLDPAHAREQARATRERFREQLREGRLDERVVEIEVREKPSFPSFEIIAGTTRRGGGHQHEGHAARPLPGAAARTAASR